MKPYTLTIKEIKIVLTTPTTVRELRSKTTKSTNKETGEILSSIKPTRETIPSTNKTENKE